MDTSPRPLSRDDYTVAIVCPMGVELAVVEGMLDEIDGEDLEIYFLQD